MKYYFIAILLVFLAVDGSANLIRSPTSLPVFNVKDPLDFSPDPINLFIDTYDFVIVGAGTAGNVLAKRLSEGLPSSSILVLEAGGPSHRSLGGTDFVMAAWSTKPDGTIVADTPYTRYDVPLFQNTAVNPPTPTPTFPYITNQPQAIANGCQASRIIGGSQIHNGMGWLRSVLGNIDLWGVPSWNSTVLLEYYRKSENVTGTIYQYLNPEYHGTSGPIQVSLPTYVDSSAAAYVNACVAAGYPLNLDVNGPQRIGCGYSQYNIRQGVRDSSAQAYLVSVLARPNFRLIAFANVTKILFNRQKQAVGLLYTAAGLNYQVNVRKEIILTAGALHSPKILLLSGIGPAAALQRFDIPLVSDLPLVGQGMRNMHIVQATYAFPGATYDSVWNMPTAQATQYAQHGTGIFGSPRTFSYAFVKTNDTLEFPNIWVSLTPGPTSREAVLQIGGTWVQMDGGSVTLTSSDFLAPINITLNMFQYQSDIDQLVQGILIGRKITASLQATGYFGPEIAPGPTYQTAAEIEVWVRANVGLQGHWYGTVKLGNDNDLTTPLDSKLQVRGVTGLRVADASVVPGPINGQPQSTVIAVAEKASDLIVAQHS